MSKRSPSGRAFTACGRWWRGRPVEGYWFDRSQEYAARRRREDFDRLRYATSEALTLSPLPCWKHLPEETQRRLAADLVAEIESEAAAQRERSGKPGSGRRRHSPPAAARSPQALEEVSGAALPCREQGGAPGALRRLRVVRGRVPGGIREAPSREPYGVVPARQLPASAAVRGRIVRPTEGRIEDLSARDRRAQGRGVSTEPNFHENRAERRFQRLPSLVSGSPIGETEHRFGAKSAQE